jgi:hypothetical protein
VDGGDPHGSGRGGVAQDHEGLLDVGEVRRMLREAMQDIVAGAGLVRLLTGHHLDTSFRSESVSKAPGLVLVQV